MHKAYGVAHAAKAYNEKSKVKAGAQLSISLLARVATDGCLGTPFMLKSPRLRGKEHHSAHWLARVDESLTMGAHRTGLRY